MNRASIDDVSPQEWDAYNRKRINAMKDPDNYNENGETDQESINALDTKMETDIFETDKPYNHQTDHIKNVAKQIKDNGVKENEMRLDDDIIKEIIRRYTRESGVRNLEREISKITRKVVKKVVAGEEKKVNINNKNLSDFLGVAKFKFGELESDNRIGIVTGLAWTEYGGEILKNVRQHELKISSHNRLRRFGSSHGPREDDVVVAEVSQAFPSLDMGRTGKPGRINPKEIMEREATQERMQKQLTNASVRVNSGQRSSFSSDGRDAHEAPFVCQVCTYINSSGKTCSMCGANAPVPKEEGESGSSSNNSRAIAILYRYIILYSEYILYSTQQVRETLARTRDPRISEPASSRTSEASSFQDTI